MHNQILNRLQHLLPADTGMELPPKSFLHMDGAFIEFVEGVKLVVRFPNMERYANPFGFMQGGIMVAAMDNAVSPLGYAVAGPNITQGIEARFKRPVKSTDAFIDVVATVADRSESGITLLAEVLNPAGKLAATGVASCVFVKGRRAGSPPA